MVRTTSALVGWECLSKCFCIPTILALLLPQTTVQTINIDRLVATPFLDAFWCQYFLQQLLIASIGVLTALSKSQREEPRRCSPNVTVLISSMIYRYFLDRSANCTLQSIVTVPLSLSAAVINSSPISINLFSFRKIPDHLVALGRTGLNWSGSAAFLG